MQELILIISRCHSFRKNPISGLSFYHFHFKGFYAGERIKKIHLFSYEEVAMGDKLSKGDDYLLWVKRKRIYQEVLEVELIKYKKIM